MVRTEHPIRKTLQKGKASIVAIWSQELGEYGVEFQPRVTIKGQAVADFIAEFTYDIGTQQAGGEPKENPPTPKRKAAPGGPV